MWCCGVGLDGHRWTDPGTCWSRITSYNSTFNGSATLYQKGDMLCYWCRYAVLMTDSWTTPVTSNSPTMNSLSRSWKDKKAKEWERNRGHTLVAHHQVCQTLKENKSTVSKNMGLSKLGPCYQQCWRMWIEKRKT